MASGPRNGAPTPGGSLDFVLYCPAWTDPNWQDEGPERDASLFDIKDSVFDRLRPALLPRDHFKKPTIYAQRFGIFPGRTDGRSRTSPTRAESREIFPASSDIRNGKELFGRFENLAKAANEHVDDYMERTRPDMKRLDETEQRFMQQYEDLVIDENWQMILFGSLTMDELQAEGYFSMCDTRFDSLRGQISELFKRDRWVDTSYRGKTADEPRLMYSLNGIREDWNARPAIQLASRFLEMDDTFLSGLLDITNRLWINPRLFQNQPGQDRDNKISNSEKLKASLILAATIAHEMMHAFASIPVKWLADPATVGIVRGDQVQACSELLHSWQDRKHGDLHGEPYFDEDPYQEVGHAFEEHVLGGGYWSFATDACILRPALLQTAAGLVAFSQTCDGDANVPPVLQYPPTRNIRLTHYIRTEDVQKYFTQSFWDVAMQKYGTAVLREPSEKPHKLTYYPADDAYDIYGFDENTLGTPEDKEWIHDFMKELGGRGNLVLRSYLNNLINEARAFDFMNEQFSTDMMTWGHRDQIWRNLTREILMIICEISAHTYQASQDQAQDDVLDSLLNLWQMAKCQLGRHPDPHSAALDALFSDPEDWAQYTQYSGLEVYEKRLVPRLIDFTRRIERELMHIESMVCELYQLGPSSWPLYQHFGKGHDEELRDRVDRMIDYTTDLLTPAVIADRGIKSIDAEWFNRIWNLVRRLKDVRRLLDLDTQNYEHNWRDLLLSMPMARKSNRKPHQRFYFLAKKEMMKLTGSQLEKMKELKARFQRELSLGSYKVIIPGEDPDRLSIAQRLSGTLDDDRGSNGHEKSIKGPSTGIFDTEAVKKLVHQLREEENNAQTDMLNRITNRLNSQAPTLQEVAAEQAGMIPPVPPKFQQMGFENQAVPLNGLEEFKANNAPFSAFSSGTGSPFPQHQPNQPPAWVANSTGDLAAWVNNRLAGGPPVAHGITPHPYALRENLTADLQNMAQASLPMRNPASFANEYPREVAQDQGSSFVAGPLGDIGQAWEQQHQLGQSPPPAATGATPGVQSPTATTRRDNHDIDMAGGLSQGRKATVLSHFERSSSETDLSDDEVQQTRESSSSGTTLVGLSDVEEELLSKIASFERSEAREKGYYLKRRSSWVHPHSKKKKLEAPKTRRRVYKSKLKKPRVPL
ncbi:hypothetical protein FGADI_3982 [Fusarium gaditjirri]|uniref:Uncharacterized protein n=1 Tax=Fusarium gaditjirri TaxID=282569 RepID=A0A8H4TE83_9HYPO|nr:hypothetical protein FGADI_3982 [Fusarium gaditjirri]